MAYLLIAYFGLFNIYTINCSFRYYLAIYLLIIIYMGFKLSKSLIRSTPLIFFLIVIAFTINITLFNIFRSTSRAVKAVNFRIGNSQIETSAHFLQNKPLVTYLKENKVGEVYYQSNRYFLEQPILFYYNSKPWPKSRNNKVMIDYNFSNEEGSYTFYKKK